MSIVLRSASSNHRRRPLLHNRPSTPPATSVGEVVGATAAECVAVCCCFPCGVANFLLLAIYKVPASLCRRVLRNRRRRKMLKRGLGRPPGTACTCGACDDVNGHRVYPMCANDALDVKRLYANAAEDNVDDDGEALALEKEMWERFYSAGFWRSSSNRERESSLTPQSQLSAP
ncbi:hypothetical protein Fmac_006614 [Flemingia macrophylla]|uniref:Uncharacterized protein n=1 Tax=Flemingia macrophylla TaxID=520843 RepID=A0ABD1NB66_9FABA